MVLSSLAGLLLVWLVDVGLLLVATRRDAERVSIRDARRLVPGLIRPIRSLATDPQIPAGSRFRLLALLAYLALPSTSFPTSSPFWVTPTTSPWSRSCWAR
jgi:hypothetical protein